MANPDRTAQAQALGLDWQTLLAKYGPVVAKIVMDFLAQLAPGGGQYGASAGAGKTQCSPECLQALDSSIEDLASGLAGAIHHRNGLTCPNDPAAQEGS